MLFHGSFESQSMQRNYIKKCAIFVPDIKNILYQGMLIVQFYY